MYLKGEILDCSLLQLHVHYYICCWFSWAVATSIVTCSANMSRNFKHGVFELLGKGLRYYN